MRRLVDFMFFAAEKHLFDNVLLSIAIPSSWKHWDPICPLTAYICIFSFEGRMRAQHPPYLFISGPDCEVSAVLPTMRIDLYLSNRVW